MEMAKIEKKRTLSTIFNNFIREALLGQQRTLEWTI